MNFSTWLSESNNSTILIDLNGFKRGMDLLYHKSMDYHYKKQDEVAAFNYEKFKQQAQVSLKNYPLAKNFIQAIESKNRHYILDQQNKAFQWVSTNKDYSENGIRPFLRQAWTFIDSLEPEDTATFERYLKESISNATKETQSNMEDNRQLLLQAISKIPTWNGTNLTIKACVPENDYGPVMEGTKSAYVEFESNVNKPHFAMFFENDKVIIDDVLEAGDEDFFTPQNQSDYFSLINELRNPGNKGKMLTLYTARPVRDRQQLLDTNQLPVNIFLSSKYDDAEGIAMDLAGSEKIRDIWKVRIDSKYLTQTLEGPIKHYQLTVPNAPAKIELISTGQ